MICKKCGSKIYDKSIYCTVCGEKQNDDEPIQMNLCNDSQEKVDSKTSPKNKMTLIIISLIVILGLPIACLILEPNENNATKHDVSNRNYEDQFLGTWISVSGDMSIVYSFEKDGYEYTATCMTRKGGDDSFYKFDSFSATSVAITLRQNGTTTKEYYHFEDEYLYIDDIEFEKID